MATAASALPQSSTILMALTTVADVQWKWKGSPFIGAHWLSHFSPECAGRPKPRASSNVMARNAS